ncbi:MAG TPA: exo-alpha-sialidase [Ktedonobacteraceae bacterium]|nr:exo-alpha-sialidase [Ktedonobacteraceae bacterium]
MSTSTDGGKTWGTPKPTANAATGIGWQPLVQPNGTVIVPIDDANETAVEAFTSTNGGTTWGPTVLISTISSHSENGGLRSGPLPSAEIDGAGKVYVAWQDCRFESGCSANDIVMSTSTNGLRWSAVKRIPIDAVRSGVDHFIPGIGVDKSTSGSSAHLGLAFYYYPVSNCSSCQLDVGFVSSTNGATSWSAKTQLAGPMKLSWLANTNQGRMVGDYISTTINGGKAYPVFAVAQAPSGSTFNEAMYTVAGGLSVRGGSHSSNDRVVATASPGASTDLTAF